MATRVYFSFDYDKDLWKVLEIKNYWIINSDRESAGIIDYSAWEFLTRQGNYEVMKWIRNQLLGTSVTVVLIGSETYVKEYVNYEILLSCERKNGLLGVYIHNIEDGSGKKDIKGVNPFDNFRDTNSGLLFSQIYPTYDWVEDDGYDNFAHWVAIAAALAGK